MEHPVTPPSAPWDAGVTLIELLIVVAVLSVMVVGVGISTGRGAAPGQNDLARFQDRYAMARSLAVHGGVPRGLVIEPRGVRQATLGPDGWEVSEALMRWRGRVVHQVVAGGGQPAAPTLIFLPNGQNTAFTITFSTPRGAARCASDGWTEMQCRGG